MLMFKCCSCGSCVLVVCNVFFGVNWWVLIW